MQKRQQQSTQRLKDVKQFVVVHEANLPGIAQTTSYQAVDAAIAGLDSHDAVQGENARSAQSATISTRFIARALVRDLLSPMVRIARAELPGTPELAPLRLLPNRGSTAYVVSAARGMAKAAVPYEDVYIKAGMPKDFLARIDATIVSMGDVITTRNQRQARYSGATRGVRATLATAGRAVHVLDGLIRSALAGNDELLGEWQRVKRLRVVTTPSSGNTATSGTVTPASQAA